MATQAQIKDFLSKIAPIAVDQAKKHGNKIFPSICIAQACCESAYGTSPKMKAANAVFGIKVGSSKYKFGTAWKGKAYSTKTKECYDGKTYTEITDMFRAYDTLEESVEDYFDLLCTAKRYKYALNRSTPLECIQGIQKAPYATSPTYVNTIMTLVNKYDLTKFDNVQGKAQVVKKEVQKSSYIVGETYILRSDLYVRKSPNGDKIKYADFTENAKANGRSQADGSGVLKKGTKVTCKEVNGNWIRIPTGWVCTKGKDGSAYIS